MLTRLTWPQAFYTVSIEDANGCLLIEEIEITNSTPEAPEISVDGPTNVCFGETVTLTATAAPLGSTIQWYNIETIIPGATGMTLVLDEVDSGMYRCRLLRGTLPVRCLQCNRGQHSPCT